MDQTVAINDTDRRRAVERVRNHIVGAIDSACKVAAPFYHLEFDRVFPDDIYARMLSAMSVVSDDRPLSGRTQCNMLPDGTPTRVKIDLFPEYIRHFPAEKHAVWDIVGRALGSEAVKEAFVRQLAPELARRFGAGYAKVGMYPIPIL